MRYYIKTVEQFVEEFGDKWVNVVGWSLKGNVDHLHGKEIPLKTPYGYVRFHVDGWFINSLMVFSIVEMCKMKITKIKRNENKKRVCK